MDVGSPKARGKGHSKLSSAPLDTFSIANSIQSDNTQACALNVIVKLLEDYQERKDVVRAACRLLNNICEYAGVIVALDKCFVLDKMLECTAKFSETKDIVESTISVFKALYKRSNPTVHIEHSILRLTGLLDIYRNRLGDEIISTACMEMLTKFINIRSNKDGGINFVATIDPFEQKKTTEKDVVTEYRSRDGKTMEFDIMSVTLRAMDRLVNGERIPDTAALEKDSASNSQMITKLVPGRKRATWNKVTLKQLSCMLGLFETLISLRSVQENIAENQILYEALLATSSSVSLKATDIGKRLQKLIYLIRPYTVAKSESEALIEKCESFDTAGEELSSMSIITEDLGDIAATESNEKYVSPKASPPSKKTSFWKLEGPDGEALSPSSDILSSHGVNARRLLPHHPCKVRGTQLLEAWPNYLERLLPPTSTALSKSLELAGGTIPDRMCIVYEGASAAGQGLLSRVTAPLPYVIPAEGVGERFEHTLTFDSEFESGNLQYAVQRGDAEYDLFLRSDLHTAGHTQWFYFAVSNTHPMPLVRLAEQGVQVPAVRVRFNIVNLTKPDSLFNMGMRPVLYSCVNAATKGAGWVRAGSDISYYSNAFQRNNNAGEGVMCYYTLSFAIEFQNPRDTYLIAYSYPYTMHDYRCHQGVIMSKRNSSDVIRSSVLCTSLGGQDCPLLVITDFKESKDIVGPITVNDTFREVEKRNTAAARAAMSARGGPAPVTMKPALFFSGRVHPGEPPASWMMKGMIDYLSSSHPVAVKLRQLFVIYIVPVLNPDGVLYGNNRCSLAGVDLNRQWKAPTKNLYPTVFALKTFMQAQKRLREICMYIDLHGHSRKYNVFMYGCDTDKKKPRPQVRAFPRFFSVNELAQKYVSFNDCSFHIKKGREGTARVIVCKELNIPLSFTLEATFCGPNYGPLKNCHMNMGHLQEVGVSLCDTIYRFAMSPEGRSSFYTMSSNAPILTTPMDSSVTSTVIVCADSSSDIPGDSELIDGGSGSDSEDEQVQSSSVSKASGKGRDEETSSKFSGGHIQNAMPAIEHSSKTSGQLPAGSRPVHRSRSQFAYTRQDTGHGNLEFLKPQAVDDLAVVRAGISDTTR
jgi:cytosolic carboxypeptidase protein 2/3